MIEYLFGVLCLALVGIGCLLAKSIFLVQQAEAIILERFGKYYRTLHPGLHFIMPWVDEPRISQWIFVQESERGKYYRVPRLMQRIDLRETVYDFPKQNVITRDNVMMDISAMIYYQITDPRAAVYEVANLPEAIERLTHSTLRNVIGELDLDETLTSRDRINHKLRDILDEATIRWGVKINRVELQEVAPPEDIRRAMEKQMRAERERRAVIKEAEGIKAAAILAAEGTQQSQVLAAEGAAQAQLIAADAEARSRIITAEAEANALTAFRKVLPEAELARFVIAMRYIHTLPQIMEGKDGKTILVPYEASQFAGAFTGLKELLSPPQAK